jgi:NTP pyrophosphatase (non-canonical NTP hydrolase)
VIDIIKLEIALRRQKKMSDYCACKLNEYQTQANVTAIYPGRLGKCNGLNGKLIEYLTTNWSDFDSYTEGKSTEIKSYLECGTPFIGLFYTSLGLSGEIGEMQEKIVTFDADGPEPTIGELGDVYWYLSQVCMELGVPMGHLLKVIPKYSSTRKIIYDPELITFSLLLTCSVWSGRICDITKKLLRDSHGHLSPDKKSAIIENLAKILIAMRSICAILNIDPDHCMSENIKKLYSRMDRGKLGGSGDNR